MRQPFKARVVYNIGLVDISLLSFVRLTRGAGCRMSKLRTSISFSNPFQHFIASAISRVAGQKKKKKKESNSSTLNFLRSPIARTDNSFYAGNRALHSPTGRKLWTIPRAFSERMYAPFSILLRGVSLFTVPFSLLLRNSDGAHGMPL